MAKSVILATACICAVTGFSNPVGNVDRSLSSALNLEPINNSGKWYPETGFRVWDPLGLTTSLDDRGMAWFHAAELKHGRVAMLATVGWLAAVAGFHFGGMLSTSEGISFADVAAAKTPFDAISMVPKSGLNQILFIAGAVEGYSEMRQPHYTLPGGMPGDYGVARATAEALPRIQVTEIKNGRLAMLGIASFVSETLLPGSVPPMPSWLIPH